MTNSRPTKPAQPKAYASTPGRIAVQPAAWMRCFPQQWAFSAVCAAFGLLLLVVAVFAPGAQKIHAAIPGALFLYRGAQIVANRYRTMQRQFIGGDANGGIVVSLNPPLVAVATDLTKSSGDSWPVIKILPQPIRRAKGLQLRLGERVATVSFYRGGANKPHWDDFSPVVVNCVTDNEAEIQQLMSRIDRSEAWAEIDTRLAQVPMPYQPGLYWMRPQAGNAGAFRV